MRLNKITFLILLASLIFSGAGATLSAQNYWNVMSQKRYAQMSQFERVQYEKARKLLQDRQYRAAATEFDRFRIQYKESPVLPYIVFLCGYSYHCAKDRFKAIGYYNEIVDFYPGEIEAAAVALYYRGVAQFDNGDITAGMTTMKQLLDDPEYKKQPVAASASLSLVWNYWRNKEPERAETYLKLIYETHYGSEAARDARNYYIASCTATGKLLSAYPVWYIRANQQLLKDKKITLPELRVRMVNEVYDVLWHHYNHYFNRDDLIVKYRGGKKRGPDPKKVFWAFFRVNKEHYESTGKLWDYYYRAVEYAAYYGVLSGQDFDTLVSQTMDFILKTPNTKDKNGNLVDTQQKRLVDLVEMLFRRYAFARAGYVNTRIKDDKIRVWNEYRVMEGLKKWDEALVLLDQISGKYASDAAMVSKCGWATASIYHYQKKKYDDAIKVYQSIGQPPGTLWRIADCYRLKGDINSAAMSYNEIENAFPAEGAKAALARGILYERSGNKSRAIAEFRRIMKVYPKHRHETSQAHQRLESLGVDATGLGAVDEAY